MASTRSGSRSQSSILNFMTSPSKKEMPDAAQSSSKKRPLKEEVEDEEYDNGKTAAIIPALKKRTTTKERAAKDPHNPVNNLVDSLRPDLVLVFIGLNPGLMTASKGHAYAHPSNLFWKLLHWSGVTPQQHSPSETHDLMDLYSIGNTNICLRPTRSGDGLSKQELLEGADVLQEKIALYKPEAVCIVGKSIWEAIFERKTGRKMKKGEFKYGWQDEKMWLGRTVKNRKLEWPGARTFVATTTSGLAASMTPQQKTDIWKPLGDWVQQKRAIEIKEEENIKEEEDVEEEDVKREEE